MTKKAYTNNFADLESKVMQARRLAEMRNPLNTDLYLYPNAVQHVINAHGKFYGLRSKYDGNGNLRAPVSATQYNKMYA